MITLIMSDEEARQLSAILDEFTEDCNDHLEEGQDTDETRRLINRVAWANTIGSHLDKEITKS